MNSSSWYQQYCEEPWIGWYHKEFTHRFSQGLDDPENACASVVEQLVLERLPNATLKHRSNLDAFVKATFRRLAQDHKRKILGRIRAPRLLTEMGEPYPQIFFEFCLNKLGADIIADKLQLHLETVRDLIKWLVTEKKCPETQSNLSLSDTQTQNLLQEFAATGHAQIDEAPDALTAEMHSIISLWLMSEGQFPDSSAGANTAIYNRLSESPPPLDSDDRLMLKLLYWEGLSVTDAAKALHTPRHKIRNRRNAVLKRLRQYFEQHGIEF